MLTHPKTLRKIKAIEDRYIPLRYEVVADLPVEIYETMEHLREVPKGVKWSPSPTGTRWGRAWGTAWFRGTYQVPGDLDGEALFLHEKIGLDKPEPQQALLFLNGAPHGVFDFMHFHVRLVGKAKGGDLLEIALEAYASHDYPDVMPDHEWKRIPENSREFTSLSICRERVDVSGFIYDLRTLRELQEALDEHSLRRNKIARCLEEVFAIVDAKPIEAGEDSWRPALNRAREIMRPLLEKKNGETTPHFGVMGHSHLDTAWLWPISETHRKAARTFSSALNLMEQYPESTFIQSTPYHLDCVREQYPTLFERISRQIEEGRWEPNGGSWIEPDCNIPSGESLLRQFLYGQMFTRSHFGYTADTFWQPDVFGYSAALPQILQSVGIRYFCTTKMGWNDTTRFPYDTFSWVGLDGTSVLAHFNTIQTEPTPERLFKTWEKEVQHKDIQDRHLAAYGWGDGGGGPTEGMYEMARRTADLEGCPRVEHTTVSRFMKGIEEHCKPLPHWVGELYLELHRGTLTSIAAIKKGNRRMEESLRDTEFFATLACLSGNTYPMEAIDTLWKEFLVLQFHDILPGTSIQRVNEEAVEAFADLSTRSTEIQQVAKTALFGKVPETPGAVVLTNTSNWERSSNIYIQEPSGSLLPTGSITTQRVECLDGSRRLYLHGLTVPPLGSIVLPLEGKSESCPSPFKFQNGALETPFYFVQFDGKGRIASLVSRESGREWVAPGGRMNTLLMGEDVPEIWDNWDIDSDQDLKLKPQEELLSEIVIGDGPLQFRIRRVYKLGKDSEVHQDNVFHAHDPRIDFETRVHWKEKYQHLKVSIAVNIHANTARHEIQFGHVERPTHRNLPHDRARFEVCNHRWTDLSDDGAGVALLNDCKYGIATRGNELRLSLIKSGRHPDPRGDEGTHDFVYSILPHEEPFSVPAVVQPAIELNRPLAVHFTNIQASSPIEPPLQLISDHVILDTIKLACDGRGYILRLYEAGRKSGISEIVFGKVPKSIHECTGLEENLETIHPDNGRIRLAFRPFQVRTLRVIP